MRANEEKKVKFLFGEVSEMRNTKISIILPAYKILRKIVRNHGERSTIYSHFTICHSIHFEASTI